MRKEKQSHIQMQVIFIQVSGVQILYWVFWFWSLLSITNTLY